MQVATLCPTLLPWKRLVGAASLPSTVTARTSKEGVQLGSFSPCRHQGAVSDCSCRAGSGGLGQQPCA